MILPLNSLIFINFIKIIKSWTLMVKSKFMILSLSSVKSNKKMLIFDDFNEILMILMKMMEIKANFILKNVNFSSNFDKKSSNFIKKNDPKKSMEINGEKNIKCQNDPKIINN